MLERDSEKGDKMTKKINTPEQIIGKLRQAEIMLNQGATVVEVCKKIEATDQTFYRWRKEFYLIRPKRYLILHNLFYHTRFEAGR